MEQKFLKNELDLIKSVLTPEQNTLIEEKKRKEKEKEKRKEEIERMEENKRFSVFVCLFILLLSHHTLSIMFFFAGFGFFMILGSFLFSFIIAWMVCISLDIQYIDCVIDGTLSGLRKLDVKKK